MHKSYHLVIFDWEGTIGEDAIGQVLNALLQEAHRMHLGEIQPQQARQFIGLGLTKAINKLLPHLMPHQYEQLLESIQSTLTSCPLEICLVPGAKSIIQKAHEAEYHLAIATNKGQASLQRCLRHTALDEFFHVVRCAGQVPPKPCPQMLEEIMAEFGMISHETLMIGDSLTDMEMAAALNIDAIGVDFYHVQTEELYAAGALYVFDDYQQIARFLNLDVDGEAS